jgi:hypothetical protein
MPHLTRRRIIQPHVELDEEAHAEIQIQIREQIRVMDEPDPSCIIRNVEDEPQPLDREAASHRQGDAILGEEGHDLVDDFLAVQDHGQPAEGGDEAGAAGGGKKGVGVWDAGGGVFAAEVRVAAERERAAAFGGFEGGLPEDGGGEARVDYGVEVPRDGVQGDEIAEGEDRGEVED